MPTLLDIIRVIITGIAISSVWFWLFTLYSKACDKQTFKIWAKIIVPQGVIISWAMFLKGIL
jgi:hypothetical protein